MFKLNNPRIVRFIMTGALAAVICFNLEATAKSAPKAPAAHNEAHKEHASHLINPHLHGVRPAFDRHRHFDRHIAGYWYNRWYYYGWVGVHRGLGTIEGEVFGPTGSRVTGATVSLRHSDGSEIGSPGLRHTTFTNNGGSFTMQRVRAGTYHVRAVAGGVTGQTAIAIHVGIVNAVIIKL